MTNTDNGWEEMESAPYQEVIRVRNKQMAEGEWVLATRGYTDERGRVAADQTFCTSVYTPHDFFPFPAGNLVCPTHWQPHEPALSDKGDR